MKKVLVITYYWPPGSGAGVQRWLKFSKYLPSYGWEPVILTIDPGFAAYPAIDHTLEKDIPSTISIHKTPAADYFRFYRKDKSKIPSAGFASGDSEGIKSKIIRFIRGNFFIPDPRRGWNKQAFKKACMLIEAENIAHVITSSPPHSTQLIGLKLKKKYPSVRWIADLRDPWTDIYYYSRFYHTIIARAIDASLEKQVLRSADRIITVGKSLRDHFIRKAVIPGEKIDFITNGYDEDDFAGIQPVNNEIFTISYIGTLAADYPVKGFLTSLRELSAAGHKIRLKFVGMVSDNQKNKILESVPDIVTEFLQYADHNVAISHMMGSSALLLIIPNHKSNRSILTGKLFEYIYTGKPVICLGPADGDAAEIINSTGSGRVFNYSDSAGIKEYIVNLLSYIHPRSENLAAYSRRVLSEKLAQVLGS